MMNILVEFEALGCWEYFSLEKQLPEVFFLKKVFSYEFCKIFKNTFFTEHLR